MASSDPKDSQEYLIGQDDETLKNFSLRTVENSAPYVIPYISLDSHVLDVGCGPGSITADFAKRCPDGRVVGLDNDASVIERAKQAFAPEQGAPSHKVPEFLVGDASKDLPFEDASFNIVHGHQFAQFVSDVPAAVTEWRRVLKPGGILALRVVWLPGTVTSPSDTQAFFHLADAMCGMFRASGGDPCVLQDELPDAARNAGFADVKVEMDAFAMHAKEMRKAWGDFMLGEHLVAAWRNMGVVNEQQIEQIRSAITAVQDAEHGFVIIPSLDAVCRV